MLFRKIVWGLFDYGGVEKGGLELFGKKKKKNCPAWPNRKTVVLGDHETLS